MSEEEEQNEPFKAFDSEESYNETKNQIYKTGYNEAKDKVFGGLGKATGQEYDSLDEVTSHISDLQEKVSESIEDPTETTEYQELQDTNKELKGQIEELQESNQSIKQQYDIDKEINNGLAEIKEAHTFDDRVSEQDVKDLFEKRYKADTKNGKQIAKEYDKSIDEWKPITDDNGNYKPLSDVFAGFAKNYATPKGKGTGGESGGAGGGTKPKFEEYKEAKQNNDYKKMERLRDQAESAGGWEGDHVPSMN